MNWDADIAAMSLSDIEKDGLQMYRNYSQSFESARETQFAQGVDHVPVDLDSLREVASLLATDDIRFVPVIACAYADELLAAMYKQFMPDDIPGGKKNMLSRTGPISTLFSRIQFAYAFDMISSDILLALDKLRGHRNTISHKWNPAEFEDFFETPLPHMDELEIALLHRFAKQGEPIELPPEESLRVRSIWLTTRLLYESRFYPLAKMANVKPYSALYGQRHPKVLATISRIGLDFTEQVIAKL